MLNIPCWPDPRRVPGYNLHISKTSDYLVEPHITHYPKQATGFRQGKNVYLLHWYGLAYLLYPIGPHSERYGVTHSFKRRRKLRHPASRLLRHLRGAGAPPFGPEHPQ